MKEKISINYFFSVFKKGIVVATYYAYNLAALAVVKLRHPGSEVEVFDVSKYGFSFGDAPVVKYDGGKVCRIRCCETGQEWRTAKVCADEIGIPVKTLYSALRRGSRIYGHTYEYCEDYENGK